MDRPLILIVAGDPSGDLHGAALARELKSGGARVAAVGGPLLRREADEFLEDLASHAITGFWEPVAKVGFLLRLGLRLKRYLIACRPAALVCIDYYGFNRRVLGLAKAAGVPAYYFISPQVWASRAGRINTLKRLVRRMLVIFPFEAKLYSAAGVPCTFVGHPLLDLIPAPADRPALKPPFTIGLLPGSRSTEVRRHLPVFLEAFQRLRQIFPGSQAVIFASPHLPDSAYAPAAGLAELVREEGYTRRAALDLAMSSSGTATLENALLGVPMVVVYKMSWPTYAVARSIIQVKYIAMANLLAGRGLVPELIQADATPQKVADAARALLGEPGRYARLRQDLLSLRGVLGEPGAARRAAGEVLAGLGAKAVRA
ncbi:MAG: lipid-A-disaccharide synthase [Elusimicrobia bacterium]|nr:lipid-A-disaccharide synthase [Elusimicrobiota bacterium]